jgi:hypothetical protein
MTEKSAVKSPAAITGACAAEEGASLGEDPESFELEHAANNVANKKVADIATTYLLELMDPPI